MPPAWLSGTGLVTLGVAAAGLAVGGLFVLLVAVWASWALCALALLLFGLLALHLWRR